MAKKTHLVIDEVYAGEEDNIAFAGTHEQCIDWQCEQGFGYKVVPMTEKEMLIYNEE